MVLQIQNQPRHAPAPPPAELRVVQLVGQIHQQVMPLGLGFSQRSRGFCLFFWSLNEMVTLMRAEGLAKMGFIRSVDWQGILESQLTALLHLQTIHIRGSHQTVLMLRPPSLALPVPESERQGGYLGGKSDPESCPPFSL